MICISNCKLPLFTQYMYIKLCMQIINKYTVIVNGRRRQNNNILYVIILLQIMLDITLYSHYSVFMCTLLKALLHRNRVRTIVHCTDIKCIIPTLYSSYILHWCIAYNTKRQYSGSKSYAE